jgi:hypothetical protein
VAATKSAKNPTTHNDTPNTPKVREGAIAKMKVAELRRKLRGHGVKGTAELKKPDLVQKLIKAEVGAQDLGSQDLGSQDLGSQDLGSQDLDPQELDGQDLGKQDVGGEELDGQARREEPDVAQRHTEHSRRQRERHRRHEGRRSPPPAARAWGEGHRRAQEAGAGAEADQA